MAPDLRLVADAAEGDADELAAHGVGDALAERGLADAGRADEGQHGTAAPSADDAEAPVGAALAHREVLGDPLLHVLQTRVLGVEHGLGAGNVVGVLGPLGPGEFQDGVEPGPYPGALGALVGGPLQLLDLLEGGLADLLGEVGGLDAGAVVVALVLLALAVQLTELLADGVELAAEQELALLLVDALLDVLGDGLGDVLLGEVLAEVLGGELEAGDRVAGLQQGHLLRGGQEGRVPGVVREGAGGVDLLDAVDHLPGAALLQPGGGQRLVRRHQLGHRAGQRRGHRLLDGRPLDPERGPGPGGSGPDPHAAAAAHQRAGVAVGQPSDLFHGGEDADRGVGAVDPRDEQHLRLAPAGPGRGLRGFDGGPYIGFVEVQWHDHPGQHHFIVERQHRKSQRCVGLGLSSHDLPFGSQVELYRLNASAPPGVPQELFAVSEPTPGPRGTARTDLRPRPGQHRRDSADSCRAAAREMPGRRCSGRRAGARNCTFRKVQLRCS